MQKCTAYLENTLMERRVMTESRRKTTREWKKESDGNHEKIRNEKTEAIKQKQTLGLIESAKARTHTHAHTQSHTHMHTHNHTHTHGWRCSICLQ